MLNEAHEFAMKCTEFADVREEAKALLKEVAVRRGSAGGGRGQEQEEQEQTSVLVPRLRPSLQVQGSPSPRRDLEPVNLNFTP